MNKHLSSPISPWVVAASIAGLIVFMFVAAYGVTRFASRGEVMGRVEVAGTALGGLDEEQTLTALVAVEDQYLARPAIFTIEGRFVSLDPHRTGFDIDSETITAEAMALGRTGSPISQFAWWFSHIFSTVQLTLHGSVDAAAANEVFDMWDKEVIASPADPGGVVLNEEGLTAVYPRSGTGIDRKPAEVLLNASLLSIDPIETSLPTHTVEPQLTRADIEEALAQAEEMLSDSVSLAYNGNAAVFSVNDLTHAFRSETVTESTTIIVNSFDADVINEHLTPLRSEFEAEPVDARFEIIGDTITVIPGKKGTRIDAEETARELAIASRTKSRGGALPLVEAAEPDITTEYLASLNVNHLVSEFTTYHPCCADRVVNIHQIADDVDFTLVLPGETFSLNEHVGQRTEDAGYLPAGTIVAGELKDTVGGGVSQFATTFYNAVFWGGYEDVEHFPHSYYFSRYPEGIEATINWIVPDLVFRNNRSHAILIDTVYTDRSITVRFFGDNDGRTVKGEQSDGRRNVWVAAEGGSEALHVEGVVSDRFAHTGPPPPKYVPNPELAVDEQVQTQEEGDGWRVTVTRRILRNGTDLLDEQEWTVRYLARFAVFEVHPCMLPGTSTTTTISTCPTTTIPTETTALVPPAGS
jgi:vancomycin resistance protein YoaR